MHSQWRDIKSHYCKLSAECASERILKNLSIIGEDINDQK